MRASSDAKDMPITATNYDADADTSFEIDEPDDEEVTTDRERDREHTPTKVIATTIVDNFGASTSKHAAAAAVVAAAATAAAAARTTSTLQQQHVDSGEQTDSSVDRSSNSSTSTPTTADVADIETPTPRRSAPTTTATTTIMPLRATKPQFPLRRNAAPMRQAAGCLNATPEDSLSSSMGGTSAAAMMTSSRATDYDDPDNVPTSSRLPHPTAAYAETVCNVLTNAMVPATTSSHRRTHSTTSYISVRSLQTTPQRSARSETFVCEWIRWATTQFKTSGIGEPSVHHALVVIFLEFFAWGLLTMPVISVLNLTFPDHTFLMNGIVMGIKGILSFLSAPLIGALSDIWGRKFFLLVTVFFTCVPIPLMTINAWWFFAMISMSGAFAVTFSVVFAYVADVTTIEERWRAYGLASATFAASLVISPALGNALMDMYGETLVVALGTAIAVLDVFFILVAVPESLPEKVRPSSWGAPINWEQADPFAALRKVGSDKTILMLCLTVLLSYLPEAGQYSCMFVYLKLKMGFNYMEVSIFIAIVGILSISVQVTLGSFMHVFGAKRTIILGLTLEMIQLLWYGFGSQKWMMWSAGIIAACGSITYPAISAFVSLHAAPESQGAVQGMITGMRGLCNGLGPAMFGVVFYIFNVDLTNEYGAMPGKEERSETSFMQHVPGPPFLFGAICVFCAILVAIFTPEPQPGAFDKKRVSLDVQYEIESGHKAPSSLAPLIRADSLAQL